MIHRTALATLMLASVLSFAGCVTDFLSDGVNLLSTAASMRVEVEVYKGPLSKNVSVQWGELDGLVDEAVDALISFNDTIVAVAAQSGYVTDCTKCNTEVTIDPHYRSKKIAEQSGGNILPRTDRPEIDTRIIEKIGVTPMHGNEHGNDFEEKVLWCARDRLQENPQELMWCHAAAKMHDDIRVLIEELHMLYDIMHHPITVSPLKKLLDEVVDKFNRVHTLIIAAKDKVDLLKTCAGACDFRAALLAIRLDLEEARDILKKNKISWNASKSASQELKAALGEIEGAPAAKIIAEKAIEIAKRINERVLRSIESVEDKVSQVTAETHLPLFATHPLTAVEWSRELERAANEIGQLPDFFSKQIRGYQVEVMSSEQRKQIMKRAGRVAIKLKAKALYWAETHASMAPAKRVVRIAMAAFANLAAEYSNQLESLADALQWQLGEEDKRIEAEQLPLSVYLRNAETTDFLNLYTWNRAVSPAIWEEMLLHPFNAFTSNEIADRVRVIERLFADHNWQKINTVYGSGQGDFSMALVKDEIGNWNLKSFDSDPTKLLKAYTNFTLTAIRQATSLLTPCRRLLESLIPSSSDQSPGQVCGAGRPTSTNVFNMNSLHKQVVEKLKRIKPDEKKDKTIRQIQDVLHNYEATIDTIQEALITSNSQP